MPEEKLRRHFDFYISQTEVAIYSFLAVILAITAFLTIVTAGESLWLALRHWSLDTQPIRLLDQLLVVLMMVEILHTVRISIRSHVLVTEPFLIVGLIASIRRILVITLEAASLSKDGSWTSPGAVSIFHASMIELGLLALVVFVLVVSITLLRRYAPTPAEDLATH